MRFDEGLTGWAATHKQAALIRDGALDDPRMKYFPQLEEERWQSMAAVPILARAGDVIGVIVLHAAAPREFSEEDVELLTHTATLVGGAIEDAQLYEEARARVDALTALASVSQQLAAATQHERLHEAATTGARGLLGADLCQLFRLESGRAAARGVRPAGRGRPAAAGRRAAAGAARARAPRRHEPRRLARPRGRRAADDAARRVRRAARPARACCGPRRFGPGDEELLRALADQTAMGLERADLIARLTARDRVKDLFDALAEGAADRAVLASAPAGCDLSRPHVFVHGEPAANGDGGGADWEAVSGRLAARLRGRDQVGFFDAGRDGLRAVVLMPDAAAADRVVEHCAAVAAAERVVLGVSAPGRGRQREPPGAPRGRARRPGRAHAAPQGRRARLRAARRLQVPRPPARRRRRRATATGPRSRRCSRTTASAAPRCSTRSRSTSRAAARSPTPRARSTSTRTRCASGWRGSSA